MGQDSGHGAGARVLCLGPLQEGQEKDLISLGSLRSSKYRAVRASLPAHTSKGPAKWS